MAIYSINGDALTDAYDATGVSLTEAYNIQGEEIFGGSSPTPSDKYGRILNWTISAGGWQTNADAQYEVFKTSLQSTPNAIPIFISTDDHGGGAMQEHRWFHNHNVTDNLEAININLGDVCVDTFQPTILTEMDLETKWVRNYFGIGGNHDVKYGNIEPTTSSLREYFARANCFECVPTTFDTSASYVVYDTIHNVKFVAMDAYTRVGEGYTMPHPFITQATMNWLISVLSVDDYDIIFMTHEPYQGVTYTAYDMSNPPSITADGTATYSQSQCVWELLKARKNRRSGTVTDDEGVSHSYDFTNCTKDLIVSLHGHTHALRYAKEDNTVTIAFNRFYLVNLVIIDKANSVLKLFATSYTGNYNEMDFAL